MKLKLQLLIFFFTSIISLKSMAQQDGTFIISDGFGAGYNPAVFELSGNRILIAGYSSVGFDSSYLEMIWLDNNMQVIDHKETRLTMPLNFIFDVAQHNNGFLFGTLEYSSFGTPISFVRTDTAGNITRHDLNFNGPQEKIVSVVANNNGSFTGYTSLSNLGGNAVRIDGNFGDTLFHARNITPQNGNDFFRPFKAIDLDGNGMQLLAGCSQNFVVGAVNQDAFLMKLDSQQTYWAKRYDFGDSSYETIYSVIKLTNGGFAFTGNGYPTGGTYYNGFVGVTDAGGALVWSKKLTITGGGVYPTSVVEAANVDILVFGNTQNYQGFCLKFDEAGTTLSKKLLSGMPGNTYFGKAILKSDNKILACGNCGGFMLLQLDANGDNCSFVDVNTINVIDYPAIVTNTTFNMAPYAVSFSNWAVHARNLTVSSSPVCITNGTNEMATENLPIEIFPNPADDYCTIRSSSSSEIHFTLLDVTGRILAEGNFMHEKTLSLKNFPHGVYELLIMDGKNLVAKKLVH